MNKMLFGLAAGVACLVGLGMAGEANAAPVFRKTTTVVKTFHDRGPLYYRDHGVKYSGGYYFAGRDHDHWGHRVWDARHHRWQYWEPNLRVYYYYDGVRGGYYPCG
jgi:hypothetical protein